MAVGDPKTDNMIWTDANGWIPVDYRVAIVGDCGITHMTTKAWQECNMCGAILAYNSSKQRGRGNHSVTSSLVNKILRKWIVGGLGQ